MISRSWIVTGLIVAAVTVWVVSGQFIANESNTTEQAALTEQVTPKVRVRQSVAEPMSSHLTLQGRTAADSKVTVRAETHGVVEQVAVERGSAVAAGEVLVQLAMENRQAVLAEAQALLAQRKAEYEAAKRLEKSGFQAQTELARAKAALESAQAAVQRARLDVERATIRAPIGGIVNERPADRGDFIDRGEPVATLVDLDPIRVIGQVSERYLDQIQTGTVGTVRLLDGRTMEAQVTYVGAVASDVTRTFPVELEIPNPEGRVIEGVTAELAVPIREVRAHRLPPSVLTLSDGGALGVKAVDEAGKVRFHPVRVLGDSPQGIWLGGLPDEITLITVGQEFVLDGQPVVAVPAGESPAPEAPS